MIRRCLSTTLLVACFVGSAPVYAQSTQAPLQFKKGIGVKAKGLLDFMETIQKMVGIVKDVAQGAAKGIGGGPRALLQGVVTQALDGFILRGIGNPQLREILAKAIGTVVAEIGKPGVSLAGLVGLILRSSVQPITQLVCGLIKDTEIRAVVQPALASVLTQLTEAGAVRAAMANPLGFISEAAKRLVAAARQPLVALLTNRLGNNPNAALQAVGTLVSRVNDEGFAVLLRFDTWTALGAQVAAGPASAAPAAAVDTPAPEGEAEAGEASP